MLSRALFVPFCIFQDRACLSYSNRAGKENYKQAVVRLHIYKGSTSSLFGLAGQVVSKYRLQTRTGHGTEKATLQKFPWWQKCCCQNCWCCLLCYQCIWQLWNCLLSQSWHSRSGHQTALKSLNHCWMKFFYICIYNAKLGENGSTSTLKG